MLPVAVGAILGVVVLGLAGYVIWQNAQSGTKTTNTASVSQQYGCSNPEMTTQTHFHTHLQVWVGGGPGTGTADPIPAQVGISGSGFCWIHTHDDSGIIHVEAPTSRGKQGFFLSDFVKVWQLSNPSATLSATPGEKEVVYVDGKKVSTPVDKVQLKSLEDITIEILSPNQSPTPPPAYTWPAGFGE